jgi:PTH1 family peptidyl-tRNA hydrolase
LSARIIFGIGNPGYKYENTKHNIGFQILDAFAEKHKLNFTKSDSLFLSTGSILNTSPFLLIKPTTYVNLSGKAVEQVFLNYDINIKDFLVVVDDINLPMGEIRIRKKSGDGGHNGLFSIIEQLNSKEFPRIRFGVGNNFKQGEMADYVLSKFDLDSIDFVNIKVKTSVELIENFIENGYEGLTKAFSKISN